MGLVKDDQTINREKYPTCSVCIANYNGVKLIDDCLKSILMQIGGVSIEIIVHDDASTDNSVALMREKYPQVKILASDKNVGFSISNNRMVEQARGEYILLLNNDAALHPDAIAAFLSTATELTAPAILTLSQYDWSTNVLVDRGCFLDIFYNPVPNLNTGCREISMAIGACMFLSRRLWNELGGFPEWIESIGEDMYLCCLARLYSAKVAVIEGSGFRHRLGASFGGAKITANKLSTTFRRRRLSERNKTFVLFLCTPTAVMWPLLIVHISILLIEGVVVSAARFNSRIFTEIYANVLRSLIHDRRRLFLLRGRIQSRRTASVFCYFKSFTWLPYKLVMLFRFGIPRVLR
jgi:GT2 family glycosyltransferase